MFHSCSASRYCFDCCLSCLAFISKPNGDRDAQHNNICYHSLIKQIRSWSCFPFLFHWWYAAGFRYYSNIDLTERQCCICRCLFDRQYKQHAMDPHSTSKPRYICRFLADFLFGADDDNVPHTILPWSVDIVQYLMLVFYGGVSADDAYGSATMTRSIVVCRS